MIYNYLIQLFFIFRLRIVRKLKIPKVQMVRNYTKSEQTLKSNSFLKKSSKLVIMWGCPKIALKEWL